MSIFKRGDDDGAGFGAHDDNLRGPLSGRIGGGNGGGNGGQHSSFLSQPARVNGQAADGGPASRFPAPPQNQAAAAARENNLFELKRKVQAALISEMDPKTDLSQTAQVRRTIEELFNRILDQQNVVLSRQDRQRLFEAIAAEILGFGPLEPLLNDDSVTEIMVNGPRAVFVEQNGRLFRTDI